MKKKRFAVEQIVAVLKEAGSSPEIAVNFLQLSQ
jgi:hypothetical protein